MAVNMVRAGGEGGFLEEALERVSTFTEQYEDLKARTAGALAYPVFLGIVGTAVVTVLIVFFVPQFAGLFDRLRERGELPVLTEWLLWFSDSIRSYGLIVMAMLVILAVYLRAQLASDRGRYLFDKAKIKMPLLGSVFQSLAVARFCRVLGTMLRNGVPILRSLEISRGAASNRVLAEAIENASENISAGQSLARPLAASGHFPTTVVEMISVAEESNTLDAVLVEIADGLEKRTSRRLDLTVRLLEPIMLLVLAGIVLFVVIALLIPVIKMSSALG
jgi:general secretion pathway protein F/type IV pilus assembly protein PilC